MRRDARTITAVRIDGLEETEGDPDVHGEDVQVTAECAVEEGTRECASSEDEDLSGMRVLSSKTEGGGVLVVNLVDVLVQRTPVQSLVSCGWIVRKSSFGK